MNPRDESQRRVEAEAEAEVEERGQSQAIEGLFPTHQRLSFEIRGGGRPGNRYGLALCRRQARPTTRIDGPCLAGAPGAGEDGDGRWQQAATWLLKMAIGDGPPVPCVPCPRLRNFLPWGVAATWPDGLGLLLRWSRFFAETQSSDLRLLYPSNNGET